MWMIPHGLPKPRLNPLRPSIHQLNPTRLAMPLVKCQQPESQFIAELPDVKVLSCTVLENKQNAKNANEKVVEASTQQSKGKNKKKGKEKAQDDQKAEDKPLYAVTLSDTILFPEGGGQPADKGALNGAEVSYVFRDDHDNVVHVSAEPLDVNSSVTVKLDWSRRHDHMQQHSAQHLISALANSVFSLKTLSWYLARAPAECFIEFEGTEASALHFEELEQMVNEHIRKALPVHVRIFNSVEEAKKVEHPRFVSRFLDKAGDDAAAIQSKWPLRVVEIENVDFNTCCGTHVSRTSEIQLVKFLSHTSARGNTKLNFVAGDRALQMMSRQVSNEQQLTRILNTNPATHVSFVQRNSDELRVLRKSQDKALSELAEVIGEQLGQRCRQEAEKKDSPSRSFVACHRDESNFPLAKLIDAVHKQFAGSDTVPLVLASCGDISPKDGAAATFILAGPEQDVTAVSQGVGAALNAKGGGRKGKFQGKCDALTKKQLKEATDVLSAYVKQSA